MTTFFPLVSSSVRGPLGVVHAPRLWLKATLDAIGALPEGYYSANKGFDLVLLTALGLSPEEFAGYIRSVRPDYPAFEAWIRDRVAACGPAVAASEENILTREKPDEMAERERAHVGLTDPAVKRGIVINDLLDWKLLHDAIVRDRDRGLVPIVPAVSSTSAGPLGAAHLPRLWLMATLRMVNALAPSDDASDLDRLTLEHLGVDAAQSAAYIDAEMPDYVRYESWVRLHAASAGANDIAEHNAVVRKHGQRIMRADVRDWKQLHTAATSRAVSHASPA